MEKKTKILAIFNKYKETFENFIDDLDIKSSDMSRSIDKGPGNISPDSKDLLTESKLDKNLLYKSWQ